MKRKFRVFQFSVPTLPKDVYTRFQEFCQAHGLSQWHGIITLLEATWEFGRAHPGRVAVIAQEVLKKHTR